MSKKIATARKGLQITYTDSSTRFLRQDACIKHCTNVRNKLDDKITIMKYCFGFIKDSRPKL